MEVVHSTLAVPFLLHCIISTHVYACNERRCIDSPRRQLIGVVRPFEAAYKGEDQALRSIRGEVRGWAVSVA